MLEAGAAGPGLLPQSLGSEAGSRVRISEQGNCILDLVAHATLPRQQHHALALPILQRHHGTLVTFMMNGQYARMWYIG